MGIYISGVKGLPEQVQENKEKIATIEEEIEGIDFDAIHNLENQVAENTQDINNMEGTIGTQNIAITQLGGRVDDLEDKTQDITRQGSTLYIDTNEVVLNADLGFETDSGSDIKLNPEDSGYSVNKIESTGNSNLDIHFNDSAVVVNSGGAEYEFINNTIQVNGTPIGGSDIYEHNFKLISSGTALLTFNLYLDNNTPITTRYDLISKLNLSGYSTNDSCRQASGVQISSGYPVLGIFSNGNTLQVIYWDTGTSASGLISITNSGFGLVDTIRKL